jgi:hypothetical protein
MKEREPVHVSLKQFEVAASQIEEVLERLPQSFEADCARARFCELCYWFSEAIMADDDE